MTEKQEQKTSDIVIRQIQKMILDGELSEGDKLPPEREMTERFSIGRPALREALKSLEMLGLIERRHGLGNFIVNNVHSSYFEPLSLSFMLNHGTPKEIIEMRYCLETFAVRKAAETATPTDILALRNNLKQMTAAETPSEKAAFDRAMHLEFARISNNTLLYNTMENISYLMDSFIEKSVRLSYFEGDSIENIYREHGQIISCIEKHDPDGAAAAMEAHLDAIRVSEL
ncbi:MAG: FadR/GntR family transcriptional regulator [Emergencia sp.]